jgi:hypothetical protein
VCYFCDGVGSITKEHIWPRWLGADAVVESQQSTRRLGFTQAAAGVYEELPTTVTERQRSVLTDKVRKICRSCNGGWMSVLEQSVRGPLQLLCARSYPFGRTALTVEQITLLAAWALKTSWMRELLDPNRSPTPTKMQRRYLMEQLRPPAHTSVWTARYTGANNFGSTIGQIEAKDSRVAWSQTSSRQVLLASFVFKGLVLLARTDDGWGVPPTPTDPSVWRKLWPLTDVQPTAALPIPEALSWPPIAAADDREVARLTHVVSPWLRLPQALSFTRHPDGTKVIHRN